MNDGKAGVHVAGAGDCWHAIHDPGIGLLIDSRAGAVAPEIVAIAIDGLADTLCLEGAVDTLEPRLAGLPAELRSDILALAERFADVMAVDQVRVRLEVVTTNACKKWHLDYTDVRLVTTYAGWGTEYDAGDGRSIGQVPTGAVGLFKGRLYGTGHTAVLHRSPQIEGTGERRLILVIDTPQRESAELTRAAMEAMA